MRGWKVKYLFLCQMFENFKLNCEFIYLQLKGKKERLFQHGCDDIKIKTSILNYLSEFRSSVNE
jgi:hypothetical protein